MARECPRAGEYDRAAPDPLATAGDRCRRPAREPPLPQATGGDHGRAIPVARRARAPPHPACPGDDGWQHDRRSQEAGRGPWNPPSQDAAVAGARCPNGVSMKTVLTDRDQDVLIVTINRPEVRNAIDIATSKVLLAAFEEYEQDDGTNVAVLTGAGATFCAGADLKAIAAGQRRTLVEDGPGPLGPTRLLLSKPVLAAVEGYAVAGGFELALWCDLRIAAVDAVFGVFCRRFGVPLLDLGTVRLPRLIGHSHAMDLILTGRGVQGEEALRMGLANRLVPHGQALEAAVTLAHELARFPQRCLRSDRLSAYEQWSLSYQDALRNELRRGVEVEESREHVAGAASFVRGHGRHGAF